MTNEFVSASFGNDKSTFVSILGDDVGGAVGAVDDRERGRDQDRVVAVVLDERAEVHVLDAGAVHGAEPRDLDAPLHVPEDEAEKPRQAQIHNLERNPPFSYKVLVRFGKSECSRGNFTKTPFETTTNST